MRKLLTTLLFCFAFLATTVSSEAATKAYLFRGLGGSWSTGMDVLASKFRAQGIEASVHSHYGTSIERIKADKAAGHRVILVGHSLGANRVNSYTAEVQVDLLVLYDPTNISSTIITKNVKRIIWIKSSHGAFCCHELKLDRHFGNMLRITPKLSHTQIDDEPNYHIVILNEAKKL